MRRLSPPRLVVLSFAAAILLGALFLKAAPSGIAGESVRFIDCLFTATSATCVTGLTTVDIGTHFSGFGQAIILLLIQVGGLGIMTLSTLFAVLFGKRLTLRENVVIQGALDKNKVEGLPELIKYIIFITLGIELTGAFLLYLRWLAVDNWSSDYTLYAGLFHAISAFCNAGLSIFPNNFESYRSDVFVNVILMSLIVLGGIGFVVIAEMIKIVPFFTNSEKRQRMSLQTKLVVIVSAALIVVGAVVVFMLEKDNVLAGLPLKEKWLASIFQAISPRTAGFNTVSIGGLMPGTLFFIAILMFIGASPGSTGGGIKTSTFGILLATFYSMIRNRDRVSLMNRTIPKPVVRKCVTVLALALCLIVAVTFMLTLSENRIAAEKNSFLSLLFETISAFGTVGLSTGITPALTDFGKLIIIITMFIGRVGPLTLALAVTLQREKGSYVYPEENVMVG